MKGNGTGYQNWEEKILRYQVSYTETEEVVTQTCKIFHRSQKRTVYRIAVAVFGAMLLGFMLVYGDRGGGTPGGLLIFLLKYAVGWIIAFFVADILAQTLGKKIEEFSSLTDGEEMYEIRMRKRKAPPKVRMEFYDDHVANIVDGAKKEYLYSQVLKLVEMDTTIGIIMLRQDGTKGMFGFPKSGLVDADIEEFKAFLVEKCTRVKDGFVAV